MATCFCEYDQVERADPDVPEGLVVQYSITMVGPATQVLNTRVEGTIQITINPGDTINQVHTKIREAGYAWASDRGTTLRTGDLVYPAYNK